MITSQRVASGRVASAWFGDRVAATDRSPFHSITFMPRADNMRSSHRISFARFASLLSLLAAASLPSAAHAQHTHGAHEHGAAELTVALDGQALVIELISPLDNRDGFEHAPANDTQRAALAEAGRLLSDAEAMFALTAAAACRFEQADIESSWTMAAVVPAAGHANAAHAPPARGEHEEVVVSYRYTCLQPAALQGIDVRAFARFPRLREIRVEHATARGQGAAVLTPAAAALAL